MMKWSTIKDIAKKAEVLPNTIHCAPIPMVGKGASEAARQWITGTADDMSFRSGSSAASLRHMILNTGTVFPSTQKENRSFYSNMRQYVFDYIDLIRDFGIRLIRILHSTAFPGNKTDNPKDITDSRAVPPYPSEPPDSKDIPRKTDTQTGSMRYGRNPTRSRHCLYRKRISAVQHPVMFGNGYYRLVVYRYGIRISLKRTSKEVGPPSIPRSYE